MSEAGNRHEAAVMAADIAAHDAMEAGAPLLIQSANWYATYWAKLCESDGYAEPYNEKD